MEREKVYKIIDGERDHQDELWNVATTISENKHTPEEWIMYMMDYLSEASHILSREAAQTGRPKAMEIVRKVVAMGIAAMEEHETKPR